MSWSGSRSAQRRLLSAALPLAAALLAAALPFAVTPSRAESDAPAAKAGGDADAPIVIEEESVPAAASDDDVIIIDTDAADAVPAPQRVGGPLGRLWETWHVAADSDVLTAFQWTDASDGPWRLVAGVSLETWLLPAPNLAVYANGFGRVAVDGTPQLRVRPFADFYEAYAKINVDKAAVTIGRLVTAWGRTRGAALGDRMHAPDLRRGGIFPEPAKQMEPAWGMSARTSVGAWGVEGVGLVGYEPPEGSLAAANQGGVRIARYQEALVRSPHSVGGLLSEDDTAGLRATPRLLESATAGVRVWRRLGELDLGGSGIWGIDEVPALELRPEVGRALATEFFTHRALPLEPYVSPCGVNLTLACMGPPGTLTHGRVSTFSLDVSWGLGIAIVRAELVAAPAFGGALGGKTVHLVDADGLRSARVGQYAGSLAIEGALGDWFDGSLELFDVAWDGIPAAAYVWGVEAIPARGDAPADGQRVVHRAAVAASFGGAAIEQRLRWSLRGEASPLGPDALISAEVRYRLPVLNLYVGGRTDLFGGAFGTPGWMRQEASLVGVFLGEGGS